MLCGEVMEDAEDDTDDAKGDMSEEGPDVDVLLAPSLTLYSCPRLPFALLRPETPESGPDRVRPEPALLLVRPACMGDERLDEGMDMDMGGETEGGVEWGESTLSASRESEGEAEGEADENMEVDATGASGTLTLFTRSVVALLLMMMLLSLLSLF